MTSTGSDQVVAGCGCDGEFAAIGCVQQVQDRLGAIDNRAKLIGGWFMHCGANQNRDRVAELGRPPLDLAVEAVRQN